MRAVLIILVVTLAACGQDDVAGPPREASPQPAERPHASAIAGPGGWGSVRIGMSRTQAVEALGGVEGAAPAGAALEQCHYLRPAGIEGVMVMIERGRVSRIDITQGAPETVTDTGLGLGATEAEVRARYDAALEHEPHKYEPPPSGYFTWWNARARQGIRYVVGPESRVVAILVGGESIRYVEGCS